jgi:hypothetical protein
VAEAAARRKCIGLPSAATDVYRWAGGEVRVRVLGRGGWVGVGAGGRGCHRRGRQGGRQVGGREDGNRLKTSCIVYLANNNKYSKNE